VKVVVASGIWPPDVGGPATHSPELAGYLRGRGHDVRVLTTAAAAPAPVGYPVHWVPRARPPGVRHLEYAARLAALTRRADVVYVNSVLTRGTLGARAPAVVKLTDDPAYERAQRLGLYQGDLDGFQRFPGGLRVRALRRARDVALGRAARVLCPSRYLAGLTARWGVDPDRVTVVENATPELGVLPSRDEARAQLGLDGAVLGFAGRLGAAKAIDVALRALARVDGVTLVLAGDGPERASLEALADELGLTERVRFAGALPREQVLALYRAADAALLSSAWENFPHSVVEALAVGTPVISTDVGGVAEAVEDGVNGLLVPAGDVERLAEAIDRLCSSPELRERLAATAAASVERLRPDHVYGRLEQILREAAR
jgi:glycosyltransferase involved in cell wall biosynthesis